MRSVECWWGHNDSIAGTRSYNYSCSLDGAWSHKLRPLHASGIANRFVCTWARKGMLVRISTRGRVSFLWSVGEVLADPYKSKFIEALPLSHFLFMRIHSVLVRQSWMLSTEIALARDLRGYCWCHHLPRSHCWPDVAVVWLAVQPYHWSTVWI